MFENLQVQLVPLHFTVNKNDFLIPQYGLGLVWSFWVGAWERRSKRELLIWSFSPKTRLPNWPLS